MNFKKIIDILENVSTLIINRLDYLTYLCHYKELLKTSSQTPVEISKDELRKYKNKWKRISNLFSIKDFFLFSRYIGADINIVPESISHNYIETLLNPIEYRSVYDDKNFYDRLYDTGVLPKTFFRCINGVFYDAEYNRIDDTQSIIDKLIHSLLTNSTSRGGVIIKPTIGSGSGKNVMLFRLTEGNFVNYTDEEEILSYSFLKERYCKDFIVQEQLSQSEFLSQFNPTSINTLRLLAYRSVIDEHIHIINAALRVGKTGSHLDNAHTGGLIVGVDEKGILSDFSCNQFGECFDYVNDVNLKSAMYQIPDYDKVIQFARNVASVIQHHRCIALDIAIDGNGDPKLIEYNLDSLGTWVWQFTNKPVFDKYTDEIINYCVQNIRKATKAHCVRN